MRSHLFKVTQLGTRPRDSQASTPSSPAKGVSPTASAIPLTKYYMVLDLEIKEAPINIRNF